MAFNFFKKKDSLVNFTDKVYISAIAKKNAIKDLAEKNKDIIFIAWFADTLNEYKAAFKISGLEENRIVDVKIVHSAKINQHTAVMLEHYPLITKEEELVKFWDAKNIDVYNSLDEPIFLQFGGERIIEMIKKMGMQENEEISHSLITKSIRNAQEKLGEKVNIELTASSQEDWIKKNIRP